LPAKSLNTLIKKKLYYKMVFIKETKLKKKINSNIKKQNIVIEKRIKKWLKAYVGFLANIKD